MPATYEPIATSTLSSAASLFSFTSISQAYTDLRLVAFIKTSASSNPYLQLNNTSGVGYSQVFQDAATPSTISNSRINSNNKIEIAPSYALAGTNFSQFIIDILRYSDTSVYTTLLISRSSDLDNPQTALGVASAIWRSTSAITQVNLNANGVNFTIGSMATLYGIKKA